MTSKGIGVVRRMDELGRVVIPKEVRKSFHIGKNEPLEILVDGEDTIILRKYHSGPDMEVLAQEYAETLYKTFNQAVLIDDSRDIIAVAGLSKREFLNKPIPEELLLTGHSGLVDISPSDDLPFLQAVIEQFPLPNQTTGRFLLLFRKKGEIGDAEMKTVQAAAMFIGKWLDKGSSR